MPYDQLFSVLWFLCKNLNKNSSLNTSSRRVGEKLARMVRLYKSMLATRLCVMAFDFLVLVIRLTLRKKGDFFYYFALALLYDISVSNYFRSLFLYIYILL